MATSVQTQAGATPMVAPPEQTFQQELDAYLPNIRAALPGYISVDKFARVLVTAVSNNPDLYYANRRTLFNSAVKCAADGLLPDGREAALVVYSTRVKQRNPETGLSQEITIDAVQYMPMAFGIRKRMRNSGDVLSAVAEVVYEHDRFTYRMGDDAAIIHEPPQLGQERGQPVGAYSIITLKSGEVLRDVMSKADIEITRSQSRAKNALMWTTFWHEAAKKTVLRRNAKSAPQSSEYEKLFNRGDDEPEDIPLLAAPPEPQRQIAPPPLDTRPEFAVVDNDGVEHPYRSGETAIAALSEVLREAKLLGLARLIGCWESNVATVDALAQSGISPEALVEEYTAARKVLTVPPEPTVEAGPAASPAPEAPPPAPAQQAASAPATAPAPAPEPEPEPPADERPFPGDLPSRDDTERKSLAIAGAPVKGGKQDWRSWSVGMFQPKLRQQRDPAVLPWFMGDNEASIASARASLTGEDLRELNQAIEDQWKLVG